MEKDRAITPNKKPGGKAISYLFIACHMPQLSCCCLGEFLLPGMAEPRANQHHQTSMARV